MASKYIRKIIDNPRMIFAYANAAGVFNLLPSRFVLRVLWWVRTGTKLNLANPQSFNEKIQWLKAFNRDPRLPLLVDKYRVREYVSEVLGEDYLIPLYGVWDNPDDIEFDDLPNQFVLKCNHNAAIGLCICRDKSKLDIDSAKQELKRGLKKNFYYSSREWAYKSVDRKIICEKYMDDDSGKGLRDYKFFCFNGEAKFVYLSEGLENHDTASISFYGLDTQEMPFCRSDYKPFDARPVFPKNFDKLVEAANTIASNLNLAFVRVDLYSIRNKVYFSEITMYPNSGYIPFEPQEWDMTIGSWLDLGRG